MLGAFAISSLRAWNRSNRFRDTGKFWDGGVGLARNMRATECKKHRGSRSQFRERHTTYLRAPKPFPYHATICPENPQALAVTVKDAD